MYGRLTTVFLAGLCSLMVASMANAEVELVMAEEPGCIWCARWNAEIGPIYPKTGEGAAAPLRRVDITDDLPTDLSFWRGITFTPTFILVIDGAETSRLEGYPGEDFFWGLLGMMLEEADVQFEVTPVAH